MQARYRKKGIKKFRFEGKVHEIPSDKWMQIASIKLFKRLRSHPDVFDTTCFLNITPFLSISEWLRFKGKFITTNNKSILKKLDKMPFLRHQATRNNREYIYRILNYNDSNLTTFGHIDEKVSVFIYRDLGGIGDIVLTTPILEDAKKRYPNYKLVYGCPNEFIPLVKENPNIDFLTPLTTSITQKDWDIVIDLSSDCIKHEIAHQPDVKLNRTEIFADKCGLDTKKIGRPKVYLNSDEILTAKKELEPFKLKIGLVLKSNAPVRNWPYFSQLRDELIKKYTDATILEFCHIQPSDWSPIDESYPVFERPLREVMALLNECDIVISPDTGLAHISSALRVPTVWIFTHIDGNIRTKNYDNVKVCQVFPESCPGGIKCWYNIPCSAYLERTQSPACSKGITVKQVMESVNSFLFKPNLSYCVVCSNRWDMTKRCLDNIIAYKKYSDEIIIVDNGSTDDSYGHLNALCEKREDMHLIMNQDNKGCIIGRNQATKAAKGRFVLTLDNDQFIAPHTVNSLMAVEADLAGVEAWSMDNDGYAFDINDNKGKLAYIGGGGLLIKNDVLKDINYLDIEYAPAWFSDPDLCFKAEEKGYTIDYSINSGIVHEAHSTINTQQDFDSDKAWRKSHKLFKKKWQKALLEKNKTDADIEKSGHIKQILSFWDEIEEEHAVDLYSGYKPKLTFILLSWLRFDRMLEHLDMLITRMTIPVNMYARIQGAERLGEWQKNMVRERMKKFHNGFVEFTEGNEGTGLPRKELSKKALEMFPDTQFVNFIDDDISFSMYAVETALVCLMQNPQLGVIHVWHKDNGFAFREKFGRDFGSIPLNAILTNVDVVGSAPAFIRKEIFDICEVDESFVVGAWDWDFFFQVRQLNWKLASLCISGLRCRNNSGGEVEYKAFRYSKEKTNNSKNYFLKKWNV